MYRVKQISQADFSAININDPKDEWVVQRFTPFGWKDVSGKLHATEEEAEEEMKQIRGK